MATRTANRLPFLEKTKVMKLLEENKGEWENLVDTEIARRASAALNLNVNANHIGGLRRDIGWEKHKRAVVQSAINDEMADTLLSLYKQLEERVTALEARNKVLEEQVSVFEGRLNRHSRCIKDLEDHAKPTMNGSLQIIK